MHGTINIKFYFIIVLQVAANKIITESITIEKQQWFMAILSHYQKYKRISVFK